MSNREKIFHSPPDKFFAAMDCTKDLGTPSFMSHSLTYVKGDCLSNRYFGGYDEKDRKFCESAISTISKKIKIPKGELKIFSDIPLSEVYFGAAVKDDKLFYRLYSGEYDDKKGTGKGYGIEISEDRKEINTRQYEGSVLNRQEIYEMCKANNLSPDIFEIAESILDKSKVDENIKSVIIKNDTRFGIDIVLNTFLPLKKISREMRMCQKHFDVRLGSVSKLLVSRHNGLIFRIALGINNGQEYFSIYQLWFE
jgi:hypothetical protein